MRHGSDETATAEMKAVEPPQSDAKPVPPPESTKTVSEPQGAAGGRSDGHSRGERRRIHETMVPRHENAPGEIRRLRRLARFDALLAALSLLAMCGLAGLTSVGVIGVAFLPGRGDQGKWLALAAFIMLTFLFGAFAYQRLAVGQHRRDAATHLEKIRKLNIRRMAGH